MIDLIASCLEGRTRSFSDEIALHSEIAAAFDHAAIPYEREVKLGKSGRVDFIVAGSIAVEVKGLDGRGLGPVRQLFRYLEDPRFTAGVLLTVRATRVPLTSYLTADGREVPVHKIELWRNAL